MNTTDLSTLFFPLLLLLGFASWIYKMTFLSLFYYIWGLLPLELFMVHKHLFDIFSTESFSQNMAKVLVYMTLLLCCWYWVCAILLLFSLVTE
jgi:hypothetical protein